MGNPNHVEDRLSDLRNSQNNITAAQMEELVLGLESSGVPFLCVVRPPLESDPKEGFSQDWLPAGFEARTKATGLLVRGGWAPEAQVLAHPSTGAFLTHCGWNSVLESLSCGVPLLGWPLGAEQFFNAKVVAEWVVCEEVARGNLDSSAVMRETVAEAVGMVMGVTGKGEEMRRKAESVSSPLAAAWEETRGRSLAESLEGFLRCVETVAR